MPKQIDVGRILWIRLGPRGKNKNRPTVAICAPDTNGAFYVLGGSNSTPNELSEREEEIPSAVGRHPYTKLDRRTVIDCSWVRVVHVSEICERAGSVPPTVLRKVLLKADKYFDFLKREPRTPS